MGGVQHQPVFALAVVGAADETPDPDAGVRRQPAGDAGERVAAGHDWNPTARLAGQAGFLLSGMVFQQKTADRHPGRRDAGFAGSGQLADDDQTVVGGRRERHGSARPEVGSGRLVVGLGLGLVVLRLGAADAGFAFVAFVALVAFVAGLAFVAGPDQR